MVANLNGRTPSSYQYPPPLCASSSQSQEMSAIGTVFAVNLISAQISESTEGQTEARPTECELYE